LPGFRTSLTFLEETQVGDAEWFIQALGQVGMAEFVSQLIAMPD
jgi:hypothetical protein